VQVLTQSKEEELSGYETKSCSLPAFQTKKQFKMIIGGDEIYSVLVHQETCMFLNTIRHTYTVKPPSIITEGRGGKMKHRKMMVCGKALKASKT
jgi:hypothetical protein